MLEYIIVGLTGGLAAYLSNQNIAVFNDGLRPVLPEYTEGRMDRKALFATSFALSFGLVIGFGIPFSLTTKIVLIHSILLGTDIIGTLFSDKKIVSIACAVVLGVLYSLGIVLGLKFVVELFAKLPINFLPAMAQLGSPIIITFCLFPSAVTAHQYGIKKGLIVFAGTVLVRQLIAHYGVLSFGASTVKLNPDGMALLAAVTLMLAFAMKEKTEGPGANAALVGLFSARITSIKKHILILSVMGGLLAAAVSGGVLAGDPVSLNLLAENKTTEAGISALARAIGFVPLVGTTAIATGVYAPAGMTFVFAAGIFFRNPYLAFILGFVIIFLEILCLERIAIFMDKFPGIKKCADQIRSSMSAILEFSLIVGAMIAAHAMAPGFGFLIVGGFYTLNRYFKKPLVPIAVGPIAVIFTGLLINVLSLVGLFKV